MKWVVGMKADPNPRLVALYNRAVICRMFPAYKLQELRDMPCREILQAMQLLDIAQKAVS